MISKQRILLLVIVMLLLLNFSIALSGRKNSGTKVKFNSLDGNNSLVEYILNEEHYYKDQDELEKFNLLDERLGFSGFKLL